MTTPFHLRHILALVVLAAPLGAQRLEVRLGASSTSPDTVFLTPADTIPLRLVGRTANGGTVTPTSPAWVSFAHCVGGVDPAAAIRVTELPCGLVAGWLKATAVVSGVTVRDSVFVARPSFTFGSALGVCLATATASDALRYSASDSSAVLALLADPPALFAVSDQPGVPDSGFVSFGWPVGTRTVPFRLVACLPGYRAADVTTSSATTWLTDDTAIASVSRGLVTWKKPRGFRVAGTWRGRTASWEVR
jgi:hypothetical protein